MSQFSKPKQLAHPGDDPNSAYSILRQLQATSTPKSTDTSTPSSPLVAGHVVTPASSMSSPPRMADSPPAYAQQPPASRPTPPAGHMPILAPQSAFVPPPFHPDTITRDMIVERIRDLLEDKLPRWSHPTAINDLAKRLAFILIDFGQRGGLGPHGLSKLTDIFMSIGHNGNRHYMALTVNPGIGDVQILLKGELREKDGKDPLHDEELMEMLREGFDREAVRQWIATLPKDG